MEIVGAFIITGGLPWTTMSTLGVHIPDNDPCSHQVLQGLLVNFWSNTISSLWDFSPPGLPSFTNQPGLDVDHLNLKSSPKHLQCLSSLLFYHFLPIKSHLREHSHPLPPCLHLAAEFNPSDHHWCTPKVSNLNWVLGNTHCFFLLCAYQHLLITIQFNSILEND